MPIWVTLDDSPSHEAFNLRCTEENSGQCVSTQALAPQKSRTVDTITSWSRVKPAYQWRLTSRRRWDMTATTSLRRERSVKLASQLIPLLTWRHFSTAYPWTR